MSDDSNDAVRRRCDVDRRRCDADRRRRFFGRRRCLQSLAAAAATTAAGGLLGVPGGATPDDSGARADVYVDPAAGRDDWSGSRPEPTADGGDGPFRTLDRAKRAVRSELAETTSGDVVVALRGGRYERTTPLRFDERAGGREGREVVYRAYGDERPVLSGATTVTGWTEHADGSYVATLPDGVDDARSLYVNGHRRFRARTDAPLTGLGWHDDPATERARDGLVVESASMPDLSAPADAHLRVQSDWRDHWVPVADVVDRGDGTTVVVAPGLDAVGDLSPASATPTYADSFDLVNDRGLLTRPGEWCLGEDRLYYLPEDGEDPTADPVLVPTVPVVAAVGGAAPEDPVRNLRFEGLTFAHAGWTPPNDEGWYGYQAQQLVAPAEDVAEFSSSGDGESRPRGAVEVDAASSVTFHRCSVRSSDAIGLSVLNGVTDLTVEGSAFRDVGDSAIVVGLRTHDQLDGSDALCRNLTLRNNVVRRPGLDYAGAPAVQCYYADAVEIAHNDLRQLPYSGIAVGWGWDRPNETLRDVTVAHNRVEDYLLVCRDGGGVYTLGETHDSGCEVVGNYLLNGKHDYAALYCDQGSTHWSLRNNVVEGANRWLHLWTDSIEDCDADGTFTTTGDAKNAGTNCDVTDTTVVPDADWGSDARGIVDAAGVESAYEDLLAAAPARPGSVPSVDAGSSATVSLLDAHRLDATVSYDGGWMDEVEVEWTLATGPGSATFDRREAARTDVAFSEPGEYVLELTAETPLHAANDAVTVVVTDAEKGPNLALDQPASASAAVEHHPPSAAVDGDTDGDGWYPGQQRGEHWQVDLGRAVDLGRVEIDMRQGYDQAYYRTNFAVLAAKTPEFSDPVVVGDQGATPFEPADGTWTAVADLDDTYRYLRFVRTRPEYSFLAELRAYPATDDGAEPPAERDPAPTDPDDDGLFEDVDGDGRPGHADVQTFFSVQHRPNWKRPDRFDFNGNDVVGHGDVVALFEEVANQPL